MDKFKKLVRVSDSLSKTRVKDALSDRWKKHHDDLKANFKNSNDNLNLFGIPAVAWQYFLDDGGIPVTDYVEGGQDPESAIATVIDDNFQDAMQGVTGGGVEEYYKYDDEEIPQSYLDAVSECSSEDVMAKAQERWGEVEEAPYDAGVRLFYPPYDEDSDSWTPYGYYSAWSHQFFDWDN